ncbi:MAG TPA: hypothetical protein VGO04_10565 [Ensifer sp.]|uniref:hypothetical protein n=1 Tax=Ensifer sp. TaxID=1872086 RepID=UPI002E167A82|nr:hypothetical protein [Ensifer sp.]
MSEIAASADHDPFDGFDLNCFDRDDLRLYSMPVIGSCFFPTPLDMEPANTHLLAHLSSDLQAQALLPYPQTRHGLRA